MRPADGTQARGRRLTPLPLALLLALAFVDPVQAGTPEQPELTDPAGDPRLFGLQPACAEGLCVTGEGIDLLAAWIGNESATGLDIHVRTVSGDHAGDVTGTPTALGADTFVVRFTIQGTTYTATARIDGAGTLTVADAASSATATGNLLTLAVNRTTIGAPVAGAILEGLHVSSSRDHPSIPFPLVNDVAPDVGAPAAANFTFRLATASLPSNGTSSSTSTSPPLGSGTSSPTRSSSGPTAPPSSPPPSAGPSGSGTTDSANGAPKVGYFAWSTAGLVSVLTMAAIGLVRWSR